MNKRMVGLVVLAGALALVGAAVVLVVSDDDDQGGGRPAVEAAATSTSTTTSATTTTAPAPQAAVTCSASDAGTQLEQPEEMPDAVYETALAVARAATACDYDELARLAGPAFQFSFGGTIGGDAAVEEWRAAEDRGEPVLRTLHDLLIGPFVIAPDGSYVFPTDETTDWRTGIGTAGDWQFFVAGD